MMAISSDFHQEKHYVEIVFISGPMSADTDPRACSDHCLTRDHVGSWATEMGRGPGLAIGSCISVYVALRGGGVGGTDTNQLSSTER